MINDPEVANLALNSAFVLGMVMGTTVGFGIGVGICAVAWTCSGLVV